MEFDKSKILTCVTADQAKVGQKGWFANDLETLEVRVTCYSPTELYEILSEANNLRFKKGTLTLWALFYPAPEPPEPTYRPFTDDELNDLVGKVVTSKLTGDNRMVSERASSNLVHIGGSQYTAENLLEWYTLNGQPCGVKE